MVGGTITRSNMDQNPALPEVVMVYVEGIPRSDVHGEGYTYHVAYPMMHLV